MRKSALASFRAFAPPEERAHPGSVENAWFGHVSNMVPIYFICKFLPVLAGGLLLHVRCWVRHALYGCVGTRQLPGL